MGIPAWLLAVLNIALNALSSLLSSGLLHPDAHSAASAAQGHVQNAISTLAPPAAKK
jgi:hypothetical protein